MEDADSVPSNEKNGESISSTKVQPVADQTETDLDVVSSDDEFVSDNDSDLGFLSDDVADLSYLSATRTDNYSGLDITREGPEGPWIRLLRLHPGQYDEKLVGALVRRPLYENAVQYVALSYSWKQGLRKGEEGRMPISSLMLQYCAIDISEHLAHALRRLRDGRSPVYIWVDAICINQLDLSEKASQIPLMAQIYGNAAQVCIWLGEPPSDFTADSVAKWVYAQYRPWWRRLWVVQECIYSTRCPIVLLGSQRLQLNHFVDQLSATETTHERGRFKTVNSLQGLYEAWSKHEFTNSAQEPLLRRLLQTQLLKCEDFHDRVYALLSLVSERDVACIVVDYRKSNSDLAFEMVTALLGADEWAYGDLRLIWESMMQLHMQSLGSRWDIPGSRAVHTGRDVDKMGDYDRMTDHVLEDMCVEPVVKSQLIAWSNDASGAWVYGVFCTWWTMRQPAYDMQNTFQRLCHFFSGLPPFDSDRSGLYEWTASSGVCGFYFSPVRDLNAKVLFSIHGETALVIDDRNGTYPGYVLRGPSKDPPGKQHKILLDFASPSIWDYEFQTRMNRCNLSESLSVTSAEPAEDDLSARYRYSIGLKINKQGPDAQQWKIHLATSGRFLATEYRHTAS